MQSSGMSERVFYDWMKNHPSFAAVVNRFSSATSSMGRSKWRLNLDAMVCARTWADRRSIATSQAPASSGSFSIFAVQTLSNLVQFSSNKTARERLIQLWNNPSYLALSDIDVSLVNASAGIHVITEIR